MVEQPVIASIVSGSEAATAGMTTTAAPSSAVRGRSESLRNVTMNRGVFVVAGPRSREVLAKLVDAPLDNAAFPWLTAQVCEVGLATDVYLLRVNFVGAPPPGVDHVG